MRKKLVLLIVLTLVLTGCSINQEGVILQLNETIANVDNLEFETTNHHRKYFDYYLPRNIGVRTNLDLNIDTVEFVVDDNSFYMTLDIAQVIINEYYDQLLRYQIKKYLDVLNVGTCIINVSGEMANMNDEMLKYKIIVNQLNEDDYFIFVSYGNVYFISLSRLSEINNIIYSMLSIGKTVNVDTQVLLSEYTKKGESVVYEAYDLFQTIIPDSVDLIDLIKQDSKENSNLHEDQVFSDEDEEEYNFTGEFVDENAVDEELNEDLESKED